MTNCLTSSQGNYSVVVSNAASTTLSAGATLTVVPDTIRPTITLTTPLANSVTTSNVCTRCRGAAADNAQVTNVTYSLNAGPFQPATTTNNWKNWSAALNGALVPGTNILAVQSVDFSCGQRLVAHHLDFPEFAFLP